MEEKMAAATQDLIAAEDSAAVSEEIVPRKKKRKPINQQKLQDNIWGWAFCVPLIVGTVLFVYVALIMALLLSFTTYNSWSITGGTVWDFLGKMFTGGTLPNGYDVFTNPGTGESDPFIWYKQVFSFTRYTSNQAMNEGMSQMSVTGALLFNTVFYLIGIPIGMVLSMFFAVCMSRDIKGGNVFRVLYYLPCVASTISVVYTFQQLFNASGVINSLLGLEGTDAIYWLGGKPGGDISVSGVDPFWTQGIIQKCVVIIMSVWKGLGGTIILYIAGLSGVNASTKEAAQIDGASGWKIFWKVTMPDLYPVIFYNVVTAVIGGMQIYAEPELLFPSSTGQGATGPNLYTAGYVSLIWFYGVQGTATLTGMTGLENFDELGGRAWYGFGAAYGMVLAVIILVLTLFQFWLDSRNKD